jgi:sulfotransferase
MSGNGAVAFAFNALRQAYFGLHASKLLLVNYESLMKNPSSTIGALNTTFWNDSCAK